MSRTAVVALTSSVFAAAAAGTVGYLIGQSSTGAQGTTPAAAVVAAITEDSRITAVKKAITEGLNDPDSAQWRNVRLAGETTVCGELNARNRMGGYVGFTPFYASVYPDGLVIPRVVLAPEDAVGDLERSERRNVADEFRATCMK